MPLRRRWHGVRMSFFQELKRRNVHRVAIAYVVTGWVLVEAADILLPTFNAPDWLMRAVILLLVAGLPLALLASWMFELTPEGIKKEDGVDTVAEAQFKARADRKWDLAIMGVLGLLVAYFVAEKIWFSDLVRGEQLRRIAVLPFADSSPLRDQAYLAEGIALDILNLLSTKTDLRVTGRTSAFQFKDHDGDFREIGQRLGVGSLLEGEIRKVDDNVRVSTRLVDAQSGEQLWSSSYDRELNNILLVQDDIARSVVNALQAELLNAGQQEQREVDPAAYTAYQQGKFYLGKISVDDQNTAINYFNESRASDPSYAEPLVGLAIANLRLAWNLSAIDPELGVGRAIGFIDQALALNPDLADAHEVKGLIKQINYRDYFGAELDFKRALELNPQHVDALRRFGTLRGYFGNYDESLEAFQKVVDRDPLNFVTYSNYSLNALAAGKVGLAEQMIRKGLEYAPESGFFNYQLAKVLLAKGDIEGAKLANAKETVPVWQQIGDGMIACKDNRLDQAQQIAQALIEAGEVFNAAEIYGLCGDADKVFELLDAAAARRDPALIEMKLSWQLAPLRDDPRWSAVLQKLGLPE